MLIAGTQQICAGSLGTMVAAGNSQNTALCGYFLLKYLEIASLSEFGAAEEQVHWLCTVKMLIDQLAEM